ncbi:alpha/beta hydrolase [Streptomyces sp. NPDC059740]|uniref:alpha/beta hydrolase n=1 Tax=Streptomyces sp. NPDC059740 TaxID=3346926 RepID=UPI0036585937
MGLTSNSLLVLVTLVALTVFVATIWVWPRLARRGAGAVAGRVGMLLTTQLTLLAALGLALNSYFGFYASFADLFGSDDAPGQVVDQGVSGTPAKAGLYRLGHRSDGLTGGGIPSRAGRIDRIAVRGATTRLTVPAYVYLPPQYFQAAHREDRFRVAVVLTGYPGTVDSLITRMRYPRTADKLVREHRMKPTILVMLRPTLVPPRDTECMDVPGGPQTETFFAHDLRNAVAANYRVGTGAQNWGVIGDSTGGYCAVKLAMRRPTAFSAAVSLSGYYSTHNDPTTGDLFGGSASVRNENDMMWRLRHRPVPPIWALVTSSRKGEDNYGTTQSFLRAVRPPMQASSIILPSGGHNFTTWNRELPAALTALSKHLVP